MAIHLEIYCVHVFLDNWFNHPQNDMTTGDFELYFSYENALEGGKHGPTVTTTHEELVSLGTLDRQAVYPEILTLGQVFTGYLTLY